MSSTPVPFSFGNSIGREPSTVAEVVARARYLEERGYTVMSVADHLPTALPPMLALTVAAGATERLRLRTLVLNNDFRHPGLMAKEAATLDVFSGGRFELGIGAGYAKREYEALGLPYDSPGVRIARMAEAIEVLRGCFGPGEFSYTGRHYTIDRLDSIPKPVQPGGPPIMVGGGAPRVLALAARHADMISIAARTGPSGMIESSDMLASTLVDKLGWIRDAAPERFGSIHLGVTLFGVWVTDDRRRAAETALEQLRARDTITDPGPELDVDAILASPYFAIGSHDELVAQFRAQREAFGITGYDLLRDPPDAFSDVIAELTAP